MWRFKINFCLLNEIFYKFFFLISQVYITNSTLCYVFNEKKIIATLLKGFSEFDFYHFISMQGSIHNFKTQVS